MLNIFSPTPKPMPAVRAVQPATLVCLALGALVWLVFGQTIHFDFVNFDDPFYVYDNPILKAGLSWHGIWWLLTHSNVSTWFPLTDITHQLDWTLFGANPGGHHFTNVLLHAGTVMMMFLALNELSGCFWRAAFASALFAVHPLRAESVAWVVERKDVLSGLFFALTLLAWARHAKTTQDDPPPSLDANLARCLNPARWTSGYMMALLFFLLGLTSKSILVTLPLLLLVMDFWPLRRQPEATPFFSRKMLRTVTALTLEKIPFFILSAAICLVTLRTQDKVVAVAKNLTIPWRIGNSLHVCGDYLAHMFWPVGLAVSYAHEQTCPYPWKLALSVIVLAAMTIAALLAWRKRPYLLAGWLWYLLLLLPVIDIMQASLNAHADRYTYLPQVGICLMLVWGAADFTASWRHRQMWLGILGTVLIAILGIAAHRQTSYWENSLTLWTRSLQCTTENAFAHNNIGSALAKQGKWPEAIQHCRAALRINPDYPEALVNLAVALVNQGDPETARQLLERARQLDPEYADAHYNLGHVFALKEDYPAAIACYQSALQLNPAHREAAYGLGLALGGLGEWDRAIPILEGAFGLKLDPADARYVCAVAFATDKKWKLATELYQQVLQLKPEFPEAHYRLGIALHNLGKNHEAIQHWQQAAALAKAQNLTSLLKSIQDALLATQSNTTNTGHQ
jgi:tetratricopeptide (TPR) repeat protein